MLIRIRNLLWT